jgi:hypothetical protein
MDMPVKWRELVEPVAGKHWIHARHNAPVLIESEILILQIMKCRREQPGC